MLVISVIITIILLTLLVFAMRTLFKERNVLLLFGSSFVNLIAGLINGLAADTLYYRDSTDFTKIKIYEVSTYCLYASGLAGIGIGLLYLIYRKFESSRK